MPILLQNLLARAPKVTDLESVSKLLIACDFVEDGMSDYTEEELLSEWHRPAFNLDSDAWVIVTDKGQHVGYADIWGSTKQQLDLRVRVHPEYRHRGIGTLLLRLAEERARQQITKARQCERAMLQSAVSNTNQSAKQLLEYEGYTQVRHYWRMMIDNDESTNGFYQPASLTFDLVIAPEKLASTAQPHQRTGIYVTRLYDVYEKELCPAQVARLRQEERVG